MKAEINGAGVLTVKAKTETEANMFCAWLHDNGYDALQFGNMILDTNWPPESDSNIPIRYQRRYETAEERVLNDALGDPKEKTYSQADMETTHNARIELSAENTRLVSEKLRMQVCFEANSETLKNTTDELQEACGKITDLERENDMLKMHTHNLEFCDKFVCDCDTVTWTEKGATKIIICPACESPVGKES